MAYVQDLCSVSYKIYDAETNNQINEHRFERSLSITNISGQQLYLKGKIYVEEQGGYYIPIGNLEDYSFIYNTPTSINVPTWEYQGGCNGEHNFSFNTHVVVVGLKYSYDGFEWTGFNEVEGSIPISSTSFVQGVSIDSYIGNGNPHSHFFNSVSNGDLSFSVSIQDYTLYITCDTYFPGSIGTSEVKVIVKNADNLDQILATETFYLGGGSTPSGECTITLSDNYNIDNIYIDISGTAEEYDSLGTYSYRGTYTTTFPYPKKGVKIYIRDAEGNYSQYGILYVKTDNGYIKAKSFNVLN